MIRNLIRPALAAVLLALLAGCGQDPMGQPDGAAIAPADAPPGVATGPDFSGDFDLVGTEPFWAGEIRAERLRLQRPDQPDRLAANRGVAVAGGQGVWAEPGGLVLRLRGEPCSDGMSERTYAYRAQALVDGVTLTGCADRPAAIAAAPRP